MGRGGEETVKGADIDDGIVVDHQWRCPDARNENAVCHHHGVVEPAFSTSSQGGALVPNIGDDHACEETRSGACHPASSHRRSLARVHRFGHGVEITPTSHGVLNLAGSGERRLVNATLTPFGQRADRPNRAAIETPLRVRAHPDRFAMRSGTHARHERSAANNSGFGLVARVLMPHETCAGASTTGEGIAGFASGLGDCSGSMERRMKTRVRRGLDSPTGPQSLIRHRATRYSAKRG